jgi:RNA polymerase sigma-70 factor (ECF subfamily)
MNLQEDFETYLAPVLSGAFGLALRLAGSAADAEDIVQDAAIRAFRGFGNFRKGTNFKAWFFRIVVTTHLNSLRRIVPETTPLSDADEKSFFGQAQSCGLSRNDGDPAIELVRKLDSAQINQALNSLPPDFRTVATLYFLEDLSYEEIAAIVDCPLGTVRSRLHRGRKLLQMALWDLAHENG